MLRPPALLLALCIAVPSAQAQVASIERYDDPTAPDDRTAAEAERVRHDDAASPALGGDAAAPKQRPRHPGGAAGYTRYVFEYDTSKHVVTTLVEGPAGPQVRVPLSYEQVKAIASGAQPLPPETQMSLAEMRQLAGQLDAVRESALRYRDVDDALAAGYVRSTRQVPNMGAHFFQWDWIRDGVFDPSRPEVLIYVREEDGGWRLTGTAFIVPWQLSSDRHPDGFAGPLDNWHVHHNLCTGPWAAMPAADRATCEGEGHVWVKTMGWMIHAWVVEDNPLGVFHMWHPGMPPRMPEPMVRTTRRPALAAREEGVHPLSIENFAHSTLEIDPGESVLWINADSVPHTVTSGASGAADGSFDSGMLAPGTTFEQRFAQPGEYAFTCTVHPQMNGVIVVREPEDPERHVSQ